MIYTGLNRTGEIETIKTRGGGEIAEVYGGINYQNPIFYSRKTLTGTSPLTFKALGQPLKDYHIFGNTVQNGTPSPDYPVDVQGVGEKTENLFDKNTVLVGYRIYGGSVTQNSSYSCSDFIDVRGFQSIAKNKPDLEITSFYFYDSRKQYLGKYDDHSPAVIPSDASYVRVNMLRDDPDSFVLSPGTIAPSYKIPVTIGNVTTPIYIGSDPLHRVGDYADEIDFANQQIIRRVKKLVLDGTENWVYTLNSVYPGWCSLIKPGDFPLLGVAPISTAFKGYSGGQNTNDIWRQPFNSITVSERRNTSSTSYNICLHAFDNANRIIPSTIKEYFENKNLTLLYVLDTPTTESIIIPTLSTIVGDNTLTVDTTVKPSAVSITGHIKPTGYGQLLDINDVDIQDSTGEPIYIQ